MVDVVWPEGRGLGPRHATGRARIHETRQPVNHDGIWWARNNNDWSPAAPPLAGKKPGETQMLLGRLWAYRGTDEGWVLASEIAKETSPVRTFAAAADMFTDDST